MLNSLKLHIFFLFLIFSHHNNASRFRCPMLTFLNGDLKKTIAKEEGEKSGSESDNTQ